MDMNERKEIAMAMTERAGELNEKFNQVLQELGFGDLEITEFRVVARDDQAKIFKSLEMAEPCPTKCKVVNGAIRCFPQC